jgi:hypothetical protein
VVPRNARPGQLPTLVADRRLRHLWSRSCGDGGGAASASPPAAASNARRPMAAPCTVSISASGQALGIKPGAGLYSITGMSLYFRGTDNKPPLLRAEGGNSEQADAATAFDDDGTGTTTN